MPLNPIEIARREKLAFEMIIANFGTQAGEYSSTLFVSHHLENIKGAYWEKHLGSAHPEPMQVLNILLSHWGEEDDNSTDSLYFTLPEDVTNYGLCVRFAETGQIESITMDS